MSIERRMAKRHQSMAIGDCHQYHEQGAPALTCLRINAGAWVNRGYFCNSAEIKTGKRIVPDPSIIGLSGFQGGLLALVSLRREYPRRFDSEH